MKEIDMLLTAYDALNASVSEHQARIQAIEESDTVLQLRRTIRDSLTKIADMMPAEPDVSEAKKELEMQIALLMHNTDHKEYSGYEVKYSDKNTIDKDMLFDLASPEMIYRTYKPTVKQVKEWAKDNGQFYNCISTKRDVKGIKIK